MERDFNDPVFINEPYFNFFIAVEDWGFDFTSFEQDGFKAFLKQTYLEDFIGLRRGHISRDYSKMIIYASRGQGLGVRYVTYSV